MDKPTGHHDHHHVAAEKPRALPSHIILQADWAGRIAGTVLVADADRLAQLDTEGVAYREATPAERRLGVVGGG